MVVFTCIFSNKALAEVLSGEMSKCLNVEKTKFDWGDFAPDSCYNNYRKRFGNAS